MSEFTMPSLGADMEAGTLVEWMKRPGDRVRRGEAIAAVETQKGAVEIEVFESGVLERILVDVGQRVPVGTVLALVRADALPADAVAPAAAPAAARISPAASRRAQELGLDLAGLQAGVDGVVGLREVEAAAAATRARTPPAVEAPAQAGNDRRGIDLVEMRKAIAAAMARSWHEIPHYFVTSTLDLSPLLDWLAHANAQRPMPERLHYAAPLIKAVALALKATPALNGRHGEQGFEPSERIHLGVAIAMRGGGLIAPAIMDADTRPLPELMRLLDDLVARVRAGRLRSSELTASTATLSNLGDETADALQPVIYPPQVAIIGCGQVRERAWAQQGALSVRRSMSVTVGGDHRVSDGRVAAKFLRRLDELLQQPERL